MKFSTVSKNMKKYHYILERPSLIFPWIIMCIVNMVWCLIIVIYLLATPTAVNLTNPYLGNQDQIKEILGTELNLGVVYVYEWGQIGSNAVALGLQLYFLVVVKSFYNKLTGYSPAPQIT